MTRTKKTINQIQFGDFQTPPLLARQICNLLQQLAINPVAILEPTCGQGNLLLAALETFPQVTKVVGLDINAGYIAMLQGSVAAQQIHDKVIATHGDFFVTQWRSVCDNLPEPLLVIGNPPWVTNAELATLDSENLPQKTNFQQFSGLQAVTGNSNFDISEWMLIHLLEQLQGHRATIAMLCKTSVARRVLTFAWKNQLTVGNAMIFYIDAKRYFDAAVDACLLVCFPFQIVENSSCMIYSDLDLCSTQSVVGYVDNRLVANIAFYQKTSYLQGQSPYQWRSGIKHDCAKILELTRQGNLYYNGFDKSYHLEEQYLYPLLKGSHIAHTEQPVPSRWLLTTQMKVGADTQIIRATAPQTWSYLEQYSALFEQRKSAIYHKQPRFAIFGIGDYSFAPWKVAIASLYKKLHFATVGPYANKPVLFDDTCYFIACTSATEAQLLTDLLNSELAQKFFAAFIFWDAKRPITTAILNQLDLLRLAEELGQLNALQQARATARFAPSTDLQLSLFN